MLRSVLELLAPPRCLACGGRGASPWCPPCAREAKRLRVTRACARCGSTPGGGHGCWPREGPVAATIVAFRYRGPVAGAIVAAKARGAWAAWDDLGGELADVVCDRLRSPDVEGLRPGSSAPQAVTWVPAARDRIRARGLDHAERLTAPVASALAVPQVALLATTGRRRDQTDLPLPMRRRLDPTTFRVVRPPPGRVLLVDDVLTTGATVAVAASALLGAGTRSVTVAVLARAGGHSLGVAS